MSRSRFYNFCLLLAGGMLASGPVLASEPNSPGWSYADTEGPALWGELSDEYASCAVGNEQSPIDIRQAIGADLPELMIDWKPGGAILDNGHTIHVDASGGTMQLGGATYDLLQYHFHAPAEHLVEGIAAPAELHFVHRDRDSGDLAVLGVFVQAGESNPAFAGLAAALPALAGGESQAVEIDPNELLPDHLGYWAYEGSLTTPPCSETVSWFVTMEPIEAAQSDIDAFTALYPMNARPVLPVHRRFILSSE